MKHTLALLALFSMAAGANAQLSLDKLKKKMKIEVKNPSSELRADEPVTIYLPLDKFKSATVMDGKTEIPSQMDDLSGDGIKDELAFVLTLKGNESKTLEIIFDEKEAADNRYPSRVHAQMFWRDKKNNSITPTDTATSAEGDPLGNLYNQLHHHGPAFESELMAYRVYFDRKQTIDLYGKFNKGLELAESLWYPTDEQLAKGFGDDILLVKGSVGIGTLKGWDAKKKRAIHIEPVTNRQAVVLAKGPVRTVVDMKATGWIYNGEPVDVTSRYILFAGQRECQVINIFGTENAKNMQFATGVMKILGTCEQQSDNKGMTAAWGRHWPVNDTIKYGKETLGMAVEIPEKYIKEEVADAANYLYLVSPDENNRIEYRMTVCAEKENFGVKTAPEFFDYVQAWKEKQPVIIRKK